MAASMDGSLRSNGSRFSLKFLILCQVTMLSFLCLSNVALIIIESRLNVISNSLFSMKSFCVIYGVLQCAVYGIILREKCDSDAAPYNKTNSRGPSVSGRCSEVVRCGFLFGVSCLVLHVVLVLFGAAVQEYVEETFILAVLLSMLSTLPSLCLLGSNSEAWNRVIVQRRPHVGLETCVHYGAMCSLIGAWIGAFTIPLDWDRPWQVWPVPCAVGAIMAHTVGCLAGFAHLVSVMVRQNTRGKNKSF